MKSQESFKFESNRNIGSTGVKFKEKFNDDFTKISSIPFKIIIANDFKMYKCLLLVTVIWVADGRRCLDAKNNYGYGNTNTNKTITENPQGIRLIISKSISEYKNAKDLLNWI